MKKCILHFLNILLLTCSLSAQNKVAVTFEVRSNNISTDSKIYVVGNHINLGNWQSDVAELFEISEGFWSRKIIFNHGDKLEFKITRGSWDKEALTDDGLIPSNHLLEVKNDTTIIIEVKRWSDQRQNKESLQITGIVKYHLNFKGEGIRERNIIVWLPPFYYLETDKSYPVLYVQDGQNIFDPTTSLFGVDWQIDEKADTLIRKNFIEPIIIVGIYNSIDRSNEYSEDELGKAYMNFIVDSLKPFIDRNYRTLVQRENTAAGGSSSGGLISFILSWEYSQVFSKSACLSPAFKIDRYDFVDNVLQYQGEKKDIKIYIDNGNDKLDSQLQFGVDEMLNSLESKGFTGKEDFYFYKDNNGSHNESSWAKRFWKALIFMFGTEKGRGLL